MEPTRLSTKIDDVAGNIINPATEEGQSSIVDAVNAIPEVDTSLLATAANQLPDNHNVTVSNPTANPETGLAKEATEVAGQVAQSEEALLLRRIVKLLESNAVVDSNMRQRIRIEEIAGTTLGRAVSGLDSGVGVSTMNTPTANAPAMQSGQQNWQQVWVGPVDQRYQIMDAARMTYATSIRPNLIFS